MTSNADDEAGLSLVEMMVGLFVVSLVLMALASTATASLQSLTRSEHLTRANHLANEVIEQISALPFEHLGLYEDEAEATFGASLVFEGDDLAVFPTPLARDDRIPRPFQVLTRDGIAYEVRTAIVWDDTRGIEVGDYKRLIVHLTWDVRGRSHTTRVESLAALSPDEQPLTVSVTPEIIRLTASPEGKNAVRFDIDVTATEPQSAVKVQWRARTNNEDDELTRSTSLTSSDGLRWSVAFNANTRRFANGGTLFEVIATSADGTRESTTIGRASFLHDLDIPPSRMVLTPDTLTYHPDQGYCSELSIVSDVVGAVVSDPLEILIDLDPDGGRLPLGALEPVGSLLDGARYQVVFGPSDLPAPRYTEDGAAYLAVRLRIDRTADAAFAELLWNVPVTPLEADGSGEVPPCPA